jgi:hypothetical protein
MQLPRTLLGLALLLTVVGAATADSDARLRWHAGANGLGLQPSTLQPTLPCGSFTFSCSGAASVPLYASRTAARSISMQVGYADAASRVLGAPGVNVSVVGKAGIASDLGVYGRVGTTVQRGGGPLTMVPGGDGGLSYGVGFSWDLSRSASAALGWDSYDLRSASGEVRELRTSLGLQWRY